jgi:hypothetical protein
MKPISVSSTSVSSPLTVLPTAKIVRHPRSKKPKEDELLQNPPDEETILRLNDIASQHPFCIRHKGTNSQLL